jgi:bifunctional non-homologous end joining protein LigD
VEGEGRRLGLPGAVLLGYFDGDRFVYAGKTGTGFTHAMLAKLAEMMRPLARQTSPFDAGRPPKGRTSSSRVWWASPSSPSEGGDEGAERIGQGLALRRIAFV